MAVLVAVVAVIPALLLDSQASYDVLLTAMGLVGWVFCGLYATRSNWRATPAGRGLMYCATMIAVMGTRGALVTWWDVNFPGKEMSGVILFYIFDLTLANMIATLLTAQSKERRERDELEPIGR